MENVRKHVDVKLVNNDYQVTKLIAKPNFDSFQIFDDDLAALKMKKTTLKLFKPRFIGMSILDTSKVGQLLCHPFQNDISGTQM